jgi:hypothetical protein
LKIFSVKCVFLHSCNAAVTVCCVDLALRQVLRGSITGDTNTESNHNVGGHVGEG